MSTSRPAGFGRWFGTLWRWLDAARRLLLNLLFLLLIGALLWAFATRGGPALQDKTVLVLDLRGAVVEQPSGSWRDAALGRARGASAARQVVLRDVLDVLEAAAKDPKITQALLLLDDFQGAGLPTLREIAAALQRFRAAGKPVLAWGSRFDQRQYFLAAAADEVLLHPMGMVAIEGFGRYRNYYRDALDKLGISVHLIRVGSYKSAGEAFTENAPSPAALAAETSLYQGLWTTYTADVEAARRLPPGSLSRGIDELPQRLAAAGGDTARLALNDKLVDGLKTRDELRALLIERGARDDATKSFRQVSFEAYRSRLKPRRGGDAVAVVVAEGQIGDGEAPPGRIGGLSTAALVRQAREDDDIKALVLRVDSPGGSAFGAELVRRELELTRAAGKPVVVSMGDLAASGGYWMATAADEIIADPATVTGSIGVFVLLPTAEQALDKLGVHTGGAPTTWLGAAYDPRRPLDPRFAGLVQTSVDHTYAEFIDKVASARRRTAAQIEAVAQGRVWTGAQAHERGLVDRLGRLGDALQAAATRAKLDGAARGDFRVAYLDREPGRVQRLLDFFGVGLPAGLANGLADSLPLAGWPAAVALAWPQELQWLAGLTPQPGPFMLAAHCLCGEP